MRSSWSRFGVVMVAAVFEAQLASGMSAERRNLRECVGKDPGASCDHYTSRTTTTNGVCRRNEDGKPECVMSPCPQGSAICDDPHVQGLLGQRIEWAGVSGAWYSFLKDVDAGLDVNVRVTAPLEEEFPDRQLVTGVSVLSQGHSLVIQVKNPSHTATAGCANGVSPCLADGGLQVVVDGTERPELLFPSRELYIPGDILLSASNLPVECRQFGGDKKWAHMYEEMLQDQRTLLTEDFEEWVLEYKDMAAHDWCTKYVAEKGLSHVQSSHAVFKIDTPDVRLRLNVGINSQSQGELTWDGRVLPELEFWQMDLGVQGLDRQNNLSGILGETAYPVVDHGKIVMEGPSAIRGTVADYRVSGALGTDFALQHDQNNV